MLYINRVMTEWQRLEKKGDDPRDDIIDYGSMRTALEGNMPDQKHDGKTASMIILQTQLKSIGESWRPTSTRGIHI